MVRVNMEEKEWKVLKSNSYCKCKADECGHSCFGLCGDLCCKTVGTMLPCIILEQCKRITKELKDLDGKGY